MNSCVWGTRRPCAVRYSPHASHRGNAAGVGRAIHYAEAEHLSLGYDAVLGILINGIFDGPKLKGESAQDAERELSSRVPP